LFFASRKLKTVFGDFDRTDDLLIDINERELRTLRNVNIIRYKST
jgi:hypothetical protein